LATITLSTTKKLKSGKIYDPKFTLPTKLLVYLRFGKKKKNQQQYIVRYSLFPTEKLLMKMVFCEVIYLFSESLKEAAPEGVDCYFDNVGGEMSQDIIQQMNSRQAVRLFLHKIVSSDYKE
jgi:NADPH:quinone reductase-like Zn-dependent oxidoreductase